MDAELKAFILDGSFPCIMARAAVKKGFVDFHSFSYQTDTVDTLEVIGNFVKSYRLSRNRLSSLMLKFPEENFENFERFFWSFLLELRRTDTETPDPRVSPDPKSPNFSLSIAGESFFVLLCHPESPRMARRTPFPLIVFNPHQQFEELRLRRTYRRIRDIIRYRDYILQGSSNPMLDDFGLSSEVFQYTGKTYENGPDQFMKEFYENHSSQERLWIPPQERSATTSDGSPG